jgi:RNA polymerase sigma-70 factor (ECF subfamily)
LNPQQRTARFDAQVLAHLDAAYTLARWITRDEALARDAVQDACLRAFRAFESIAGPNPKAWFLAVVRNACIDLLRRRRGPAEEEAFDDDVHGHADGPGGSAGATPEDIAERASDAQWLHACIDGLPPDYREVIVLRELEELSYREISTVVDIPIGTVMSRLARARDLLQQRMVPARKRGQR